MLFLLFQENFDLDLDDPWIQGSLLMNLMNRTRQRRHYLKAAYFDHAEDKAFVARTPPHVVSHMSEDQWGKLVDKWSTTRSKVASLFTEPCH